MHRTSSSVSGADVPPGALVSFVQKGLQYLELEANLTEVRAPGEGCHGALCARWLSFTCLLCHSAGRL